MDISVIIITKNRSSQLNNCLRSLVKQKTKPFEVLIVDSSDSYETKKITNNYKSSKSIKLKYIKIPHVSIPYARNFGLRKSQGEIIVFTDDDCTSDQNWVSSIIDSHKTNKKAAAIGGKVVTNPNATFWQKVFCQMMNSYNQLPEKKHQETFLTNNNLSFKKKIITKYNLLFDEGLLTIEDIDICLRLKYRGETTLYDPSISISHDFRPTWSGFLKNWFFYGQANYLFYQKYSIPITKALINEFSTFTQGKNINYKLGFLLARTSWTFGIFNEYIKTLILQKKFNIAKKINQLSLKIPKLLKSPISVGYPNYLMIEPTNICNAKCPLCPTGSGQLRRKKGFMSLSTFKNIINQIYLHSQSIILWNYGEPFLNNQIFQMIKYAKEKQLNVISSTNGSLFNHQEDLYSLVESNLSKLIISLDGTDQKTFSKYRVGLNFKSIVKGIKQLTKIQKLYKKTSPRLEIQFIVMKHNQGQINQIKELAKKLKVSLTIKKLNAKMVEGISLSKWLPDESKYCLYKKSGKKQYTLKRHLTSKTCEIWSSFVINWDGTVNPCCYDYQGQVILGNIHQDKIVNIWNSSKFSSFRKMVLKNPNKNSICNKCPIDRFHSENFYSHSHK